MDDGIEYQQPNGSGAYYGGGGGYGGFGEHSNVPPHVDKALGDGLGTITACGASNVTLLIVLVGVTLLCVYLIKRNGALVDQVLSLLPAATAAVNAAVKSFEEKVDVLAKCFKKD